MSFSPDTTVTTSTDNTDQEGELAHFDKREEDNEDAPDSTVDENNLDLEVCFIHHIWFCLNQLLQLSQYERVLAKSENATGKDNDREEAREDDNGVIKVDKVVVTLLERELWTQFSKLGTEMIITKAGR